MFIKQFFRKDNPFDYIILGFIMRLFGNVFQLFLSHQITDAFFGTICWILIFQGISKIPGKLKFPFKGFYGFLVKFFLFLCFIMIIRGYMIDYNYIWSTTVGAINYHLFYPTYLICYLMPFVALIPIRYFNFRLVSIYAILFIVITGIATIAFRNEIMQTSLNAAMGIVDEDGKSAQTLNYCGQFVMLSLFYKYLPKRTWLITMIGVVLCLLLMVIGARRGGTLTYVIFLVGALYFYSSSKYGFAKLLSRVFAVVGLIGFVYFVVNSSMSNHLMERGLMDNRTNVEEIMLNQMSDLELFFGKGLNGRYYCPFLEIDRLNGWRYVIETGFYNLVLKGGYLLACLYIIVLIIPIYKGWFRSNNFFCKASAFFIMYHLITQKTFGLLTFNLSFFFLWMTIVCCMNQEIRKMNDEEIKEYFFYNLL